MSPYDRWVTTEWARLELSRLLDENPWNNDLRRELSQLGEIAKTYRKMFTKGSRR